MVDVEEPSATNEVGDAMMVDPDGDTACATVKLTVVTTEPEVARTVRVPSARAVTNPVPTPEAAAVTTVLSPTTSHVTLGFEMGWPAAFSTVAVSVTV